MKTEYILDNGSKIIGNGNEGAAFVNSLMSNSNDVNFIHQFKNLKMKYNIYSTFIVDRIKHIVTYDADPVKPFNLGTITDEYTLLKNFRTLKELNKYVTEKFNI